MKMIPLLGLEKVSGTVFDAVDRAENYRWGSLYNWQGGDSPIELAKWPIRRLPAWVERVNEALTARKLQALRHCVTQGSHSETTRGQRKPLKSMSWSQSCDPEEDQRRSLKLPTRSLTPFSPPMQGSRSVNRQNPSDVSCSSKYRRIGNVHCWASLHSSKARTRISSRRPFRYELEKALVSRRCIANSISPEFALHASNILVIF